MPCGRCDPHLREVEHAGRSGFEYTAIGIAVAMLVGLLLGRLLLAERNASLLISTGTAICGGSAIAAVGPVANANEEEMAVALGTVFVLNSIALLLFPLIGWQMHLSQAQFGLWSALAIHDTSSVVGAAAKYGPQALTVGTTVKLARARCGSFRSRYSSHRGREAGLRSSGRGSLRSSAWRRR